MIRQGFFGGKAGVTYCKKKRKYMQQSLLLNSLPVDPVAAVNDVLNKEHSESYLSKDDVVNDSTKAKKSRNLGNSNFIQLEWDENRCRPIYRCSGNLKPSTIQLLTPLEDHDHDRVDDQQQDTITEYENNVIIVSTPLKINDPSDQVISHIIISPSAPRNMDKRTKSKKNKNNNFAFKNVPVQQNMCMTRKRDSSNNMFTDDYFGGFTLHGTQHTLALQNAKIVKQDSLLANNLNESAAVYPCRKVISDKIKDNQSISNTLINKDNKETISCTTKQPNDKATLSKARAYFQHLDCNERLELKTVESPKIDEGIRTRRKLSSRYRSNLATDYNAYSKVCDKVNVKPLYLNTFIKQRSFFAKDLIYDGFLDE